MDYFRRFDPSSLAVFGGILSAGLALFPLNLHIISFILTYFAALPLYFIGLSFGLPRLIIAALVALSVFVLGAGLHAGLAFILTTLLPALFIVYRFQKGDPAGYIVSWVTTLTIIIFGGIILILSSQSINVLDLLQSWFALFADESAVKNLHGQLISFLPGISSISWIMMCLVNASLAQRLAVKAHLSQRPYPLPTDSQLHENWDIVLIISLLLYLTNAPTLSFVGKNVALIVCVPLFLMGLSVLYTWLEQFENPKLWMVGVVFVSIFLVWPGIIIVILGVLEPTFHLRQRWTPTKN